MKTTEILKSLKVNEFLAHSTIPLGYTPGLPTVSSLGGEPCLIIPFLKYQMTGKIDATNVFPPRFLVTVTTRQAIVVGFSDLSYDSRFNKVDFNKPIGTFRHAAIHHLNKKEYNEMREKCYDLLDTLCESLDKKADFDEMDAQRLSKLFSIILEPSVKPFYHAINRSFYETYINKE